MKKGWREEKRETGKEGEREGWSNYDQFKLESVFTHKPDSWSKYQINNIKSKKSLEFLKSREHVGGKKIAHKEWHMIPISGHGVSKVCNFMKQSSVHL